MNIGLVTGEYPPMQGGVGAFTQELARAMAVAGHQVTIITSTQARPALENGRQWRALLEPVELEFARLLPVVRRWRWPALAKVAGLAQRYELALINIQYQAAAYDMRSMAINWLPWRLKGLTRTVVTFHDLRLPYLMPKAGKLRQWALQFMAQRTNGVIASNNADFARLSSWLPPAQLRQIPIGSNIQARTPEARAIAAARQKLALPDGASLLGYFGFLNESKGADVLLSALAALDEKVHLVFIGGRTGTSDNDNNQAFLTSLDGQLASLDINQRVHWTGFLSESEVSNYLHAADLIVLPYRDGASFRRGSLMAALAHGRPVVTTLPTFATPELVHGQNSWFVPAGDAPALGEAINCLLAAPEQRLRLSERARAVADLFTWDKIAAQTLAFYEEVIAAS